jgi:type VI secretion system secreted protein Hcp
MHVFFASKPIATAIISRYGFRHNREAMGMSRNHDRSDSAAILQKYFLLVPLILLGHSGMGIASPVQHFLKIDGVEGESDDTEHKGEIDVLAWSWGETTQPAASEHALTDKVSMDAFWFVARLSKASPKLMQACASGEHFPKAVLTTRKAGRHQEDYLTITLTDIIISSYSTDAANRDEGIPTDHIGIGFGKILIQYRGMKTDGTLGR